MPGYLKQFGTSKVIQDCSVMKNKRWLIWGSGRIWLGVPNFGLRLGVISQSTMNRISDFGSILFGEHGIDPFLEDIRTLWLIHWNLSTNVANPLLAWDFVLNRWHEPEISGVRS